MLTLFKLGLAVAILALAHQINAQSSCSNLGDLQVFLDPSCSSNPGPGCNAGGQGQNCRFCGFDIFPDCEAQKTTTKGPTGPTKPKTTRTTRKRTTRTTQTRPANWTRPPVDDHVEDEYNQYGERLIFRDDFDTFDFKKWKHDLTMSGGGNWEFQLYHNNRTNTYVEDGILFIHPTLTSERIGEDNLAGNNYRMDMWGGSPVDECTGNNFYGCERIAGAGGNIINPIQSAKLTTVESFSFKYGRVEFVAKLPRGDWLWPALWMLPRHNEYGMWPASGEIDILESRGNDNIPNSMGGGNNGYGSALHWGADWTQNRFDTTQQDYFHDNGRLCDDFHTYGLYWSEDRIYTYIDDPSNIVLDVDMYDQTMWEKGEFSSNYANPWKTGGVNAPFDKEMYLIMNLAVGGTVGYFKDTIPGKPWNNESPNAVNEFYNAKSAWLKTWEQDPTFQIDSVEVWSFD